MLPDFYLFSVVRRTFLSASLNESQEDVNKAPGEAWGCGGLLAQALLGAGGNQCFFPASAVLPNGDFQGWAGTSLLRAGSVQQPPVFLWSRHHSGGGANVSCS